MGLSGISVVMDAAAGNGTIAVLRDATVVAHADVVMRSADEERFFPALLDTMSSAAVQLADVHQLIVGAGPGSFTALRVVAAIAKGMAQGRDLPLYAVPSLALMLPSNAMGNRWIATLDALRGERYAALVTRGADGQLTAVEQLGVLPIADLASRAEGLGLPCIGPDETQVARPDARAVTQCVELVLASGPVPLASWEPMYGRLAEAQVKWEAAHGRPLA